MNMKHLITFILATIVSSASALACTSVIITSKASKDGRPMIFKNRDTGSLSNICIERQGTLYRYVGIANARDTIPQEIWGGHNEKGFAIINTADYNLNEKNEKEELEGEIMRIALGECATLADFEKFLDQRERPLCVNTNYGVIDQRSIRCSRGISPPHQLRLFRRPDQEPGVRAISRYRGIHKKSTKRR